MRCIYLLYLCCLDISNISPFCYSWINSNLLRFSKNLKLTDGYKCKSFKFDYCCRLKFCANLNSFCTHYTSSNLFMFFVHVKVNVTKKRVYTVQLNNDFWGESTLYKKNFSGHYSLNLHVAQDWVNQDMRYFLATHICVCKRTISTKSEILLHLNVNIQVFIFCNLLQKISNQLIYLIHFINWAEKT